MRSPALGLPLPPIPADLHVHTWAIRTLTSSAVQGQSNAPRFSAEILQKAFQWNPLVPRNQSEAHFLKQAVTPSISPSLNNATTGFAQGASLKVPHFADGAPLLGSPVSMSPRHGAPVLLHPLRPTLPLPSPVATLFSGGRQFAVLRSFSSTPSPSEPQGWVQRLRSQTRSAVAQPRSVAAGVADRGAAAFDSLTGAGARYRHALGLQVREQPRGLASRSSNSGRVGADVPGHRGHMSTGVPHSSFSCLSEASHLIIKL